MLKNAILILGWVAYCISLAFVVHMKSRMDSLESHIESLDTHTQESLGSLEGRIELHEGKGYLVGTDSCMLTSDALGDPPTARRLLEACLKAYKQKHQVDKGLGVPGR